MQVCHTRSSQFWELVWNLLELILSCFLFAYWGLVHTKIVGIWACYFICFQCIWYVNFRKWHRLQFWTGKNIIYCIEFLQKEMLEKLTENIIKQVVNKKAIQQDSTAFTFYFSLAWKRFLLSTLPITSVRQLLGKYWWHQALNSHWCSDTRSHDPSSPQFRLKARDTLPILLTVEAGLTLVVWP